MIRLKLFFALCIAGFLIACCANAQTSIDPLQNTYAVVVGISQYQIPLFPGLLTQIKMQPCLLSGCKAKPAAAYPATR